ncbi:AMP-dependent synthetase/ligase [Futiania mangrovi]|uniref:Long-chain fatty acid--CoA ligase n=1 Tax=Futiania mangrovi TaxID=2959716 RepID=A0A9J6PA73_9PROT|nr:long-chain fatty acid--CoA ligase [Futiania mangrovii]MCP1336948.1 long-chain fatty acid--CoA ligase [Futiania mangrovii]
MTVTAGNTSAPIVLDGCDTPVALWAKRCKAFGARVCHREKDLGIWQSFTWTDYFEQARRIGMGLIALGLQRGEAVSILSEDRKEWLYCDYGIAAVGGIPSGVYTTDSAQQLAYLVNDSGSTFLFLENDEQLDKYLEIRASVPTLRKVIVFDAKGLRDFHDDKVIFLDRLYELGDEAVTAHPDRFEEEIAKAKPEDVRMLIYTSGTTGPPKGAMISHLNVMYQITAGLEILETRPGDEQLCFLPLCHILERLVSTEFQVAVGTTINFAESPETVFENLQEVSPHVFTGVPRVWEKMYSRISIMRSEATAFGRWAFDRALAAGAARLAAVERGARVPPHVALNHLAWDLLVLRNLRRMLGLDRCRRGTTGAAPISPELLRWFGALGVPLVEGYGMTESSGVVSVNTPARNAIGTVGPALPRSEVRIAETGEVLVRGANVFPGYWNKPDKTAETIDAEGWLHTGDVGRLDASGNLTITGRLKDIIITAGGKNITPAEIESRLKFSPYVSDAVVIGDRRKYLTALVMIDQENVEKFAQDNRIPFTDFASLCAAPQVVDLIDCVVRAVNRDFAQVEQIKKFRLIDVLLTAEDDELTPTMKLKRGFVENKHKALIDSMYAET